ncbi:MAG: MCE family protein [Deltaproteobacteria bacterium]|nr:MCE family protein [Deltaproteobacteria bacterium]
MKGIFSGAKVGLFLLIVAAASWWAFHAVVEGIGGAKGYKIHALFNDATGLVDKSMVQIAGLRVGQIVNRSLQERKARVDIFVAAKHKIYENATITKKSTSLMGGFYLEIDPGTPEMVDPVTGLKRKSRVLKNNDRIMVVFEPTTTGDLINNAGQLLPEIQKLVLEVRKLTTQNVKTLINNTDNAIVSNSKALHSLIGRIDTVAQDVQKITRSAPTEIDIILRNIRQTTRDLRGIVGRTGGRIDGVGDSLQTGLTKINKLIDKLDANMNGDKSILGNTKGLTHNIKEITEKINKGEGTIGKFVTSDTIANDIEKITGDVKGFIGGLTSLQTEVGLRSEYNLIANTVKTYISVNIFPRHDKYYLIELIDDPRGLRSTSYTVTRTDNPEIGPPLSRVEQITVTDSFRFSFMFAKKIDLFTFRFGIKESTGGGGIDLHLMDNKLQLHADIFDFSANVFPRVKVGLMWEFYRRMYLIAGIDDLMNERPRTGAGGGRDFFIGAQIRFTDEDLKALLMVGGSAIGSLSK